MRRRRFYGWGVGVSGLSAVFFAWALWLGGPPGAPAPDGAVAGEGFSFVVPTGWNQTAISGSGRWSGLVRLTDGAASIDILAAPAEAASSATTAQGAFFAAALAFSGGGPRVESTAADSVDGLKAARILVSGTRETAAARIDDFRGALVLVPTARSSLAIRFSASAAAWDRQSPVFDRFLLNLRITSRPPSWRRLRI